MKKIIFVLITLIGFISCTKSQKIDTKIENKKDMPNNIENILRKQILAGYSENEAGLDGGSSYPYSDIDMQVCVELSENILKSQGYKFPSQTEFGNKVKEIFKFTNKQNPICFLVEYNCPMDTLVYQFDINYITSNKPSVFIFFDKKFISEPLFIPELIDYKKEYPKIAENENSIPEKKTDKYGSDVYVTKWKDLDWLNEIRHNNIQTLVNRNKYLFNDSKASFAWLKFNDSLFLESLVKTFGYMNDKDLLQWVLDRTLSKLSEDDIKEYNSLFFMKDCSNKFVFHKETFDLMKENINTTYLKALWYYLENRKDNQELQSLTFEQKAQILAYVMYIGEYFVEDDKYMEYRYRFMGPLYEHSGEGDKYDKEFIKNNYYNLPGFKKLWEQAKEEGDGIGLPM